MTSRNIRLTMEALGDFIERGVRRLQARVYQTLTSASPVDTGFFRAGWVPSATAPSGGPSERPTSAEAARAQAALLFREHQAASDALARGYTLSQGLVFIVNPVSYGPRLNSGSSAQAPAMFVERAVAVAVAETRREIAGTR